MDPSVFASVVLVLGAGATLAIFRHEAGSVPNYVPVGRLTYIALAAGLLVWDPALAVLVVLAGTLGRLRDTSYADRYRSRAKALSAYDAPDSPAELGRATIRRLRRPITR